MIKMYVMFMEGGELLLQGALGKKVRLALTKEQLKIFNEQTLEDMGAVE